MFQLSKIEFSEHFSTLKCSDDYFKKSNDCKLHKVKCLQFERSEYEYKGDVKKKLSLVEKYLILPELIDLLRKELHDFLRHRFNVNYTRNLWNQVEEHLNEKMIVKIQDFSENYTCLLLHEVQSMHWTQNQCSCFAKS